MAETDIYIEWLNKLKAESKISYEKLGSLLNYSDAGISKAMKKSTLSVNQIILIADKLNLRESLEKFVSNNLENKTDLALKDIIGVFKNISEDELSLLILKFKDRFVSNEVISLIVEKRAVELAKKILIEDIKSKI